MRKKIIIMTSLSLLVMYYCIQKAAIEPLVTYKEAAFDESHKPTILWDIHDVILQKDIRAQLQALWNFSKKKELLTHISLAMSKEMLGKLFGSGRSEATAEVFMVIAARHHNNALAELIATLANTQRIIPETAAIIRELHERGYSQHIGSNIGTKTFENLLTRPYAQSIFNAEIFDLDASQLVVYDPDNLGATIQKPNLFFYDNYLRKNNLDAQDVVFIDDKTKNVRAAQESGMYALQFKDPDILRKDLWLLLGIKAR